MEHDSLERGGGHGTRPRAPWPRTPIQTNVAPIRIAQLSATPTRTVKMTGRGEEALRSAFRFAFVYRVHSVMCQTWNRTRSLG